MIGFCDKNLQTMEQQYNFWGLLVFKVLKPVSENYVMQIPTTCHILAVCMILLPYDFINLNIIGCILDF
jgi:hypothetical protein